MRRQGKAGSTSGNKARELTKVNTRVIRWCHEAHGLRSGTLNWFRGQSARCVCELSCVKLFATPGSVAHQAPLSMRFSSQEYWSGLPFPSPGDLFHPGYEPTSPALTDRFFTI